MSRATTLGLRLALIAGAFVVAGSFSVQTANGDTPVPANGASPILLYSDRDDDDADGIIDSAEDRLDGAASTDVGWLPPELLPADRGSSALRSPLVRWVADAQPLAPGVPLPARARNIGLQGLAPGRTKLELGARSLNVSVVEFTAVDARGSRVDLARSHASISRVLPAFLTNDDAGASDQDALRWIATGETESVPSHVEIRSFGPSGRLLDALGRVELWELPCPAQVDNELSCRGTPLIRATVDRIDRTHPESAGRSLRAEVGGRLVVLVAGKKAASIRVGGPRGTALGDLSRYRGRLRVHVLRASPGGPPAIGGSPAQALDWVRAEVDTANLLWGQCGIHFGTLDDLWIRLQDPPPSHLLAVGCGLGLPASGGKIRIRVAKNVFEVDTHAGEPPLAVAARVANALGARGLNATVSRNPRIEPGALETADVLVRQGEALAQIEPDGDAPVSTDPSLSACIGTVQLSDGLTHFTDYDAASGTLEERTLVKAYADRDPTTVEVFVVPAFSGSGRVGESFLDAPGTGINNTVIVDRAAIRAGAQSHVLSHELGHVLLDMPGHPDDYGVDRPSALMDGDATDPSIFGPRRLSVAECERAIRQRGPTSPAPLLEHWPLFKTTN